MHAFLIVSDNKELFDTEIKRISENIKGELREFTLEKINDVRELTTFTRLSLSQKVIIVLKDIDKASEEALNAFLKSLEEPQENLYYILTTQSIGSVLPTIISRCQVIRVRNGKKEVKDSDIEKFLRLSIGKKLDFVGSIKDRGEALSFVKNFVTNRHSALLKENKDTSLVREQIEVGLEVYSRLLANGNVLLQLTNMVVNLPLQS